MKRIIAQTGGLKPQRISWSLFFPIVLFLTVILPLSSPAQVLQENGPEPVIVQIREFQSIRMELAAYKAVGDQIEAKRAKERNASALDPFWQAGFWRYIPFVPGGPQKIVEDAFLTPNYLSFRYRRLDLGLAMSEKRSLWEIVSKRAKPGEKR